MAPTITPASDGPATTTAIPRSACAGEAVTLQPTRVNVMVAVDGEGDHAAAWPQIKSAISSLREGNRDAAFGAHLFWTDRINALVESNFNGSNNPCGMINDKLLELGASDAAALTSFLGDTPPGPISFAGLNTTVSLIENMNYHVKNADKLAQVDATNFLIVFTMGADTCYGQYFTDPIEKLVAFQKVALELAGRNIRVIPVGLFPKTDTTSPNYQNLKTVLEHGGSGLTDVPTLDDPDSLIATIGQATTSCRFVAAGATSAAADINPFQLKLSINGVEVPRDRRQQDGWDVVRGANTQVELFGPSCEAVRLGQQVQVEKICADDICGTAVVSAETKPRVVQLLLDSSASRTECSDGTASCVASTGQPGESLSYWVVVQRALNAALVAPVNDDVAFGMQFFPAKTAETLTCEVAPEPEFPPVEGSQIQIMKAMLEKIPLGLSPIVGIMESVAAAPGALTDPGVNGAVILLSDGGDNCAMVPQPEIVTRLDAATQKLFDMGVKTYAIRYGSAAGETPEQNEQLTTIATRGGTATMGGAKAYLDAKSADDLNAALAEISDKLASCSFALSGLDPTVDKNRTNLYLNGEQVGFDQTASRQAGWGWLDAERTSIELFGEACTAYKTNRRTRVVVEFGCEQVVIAPD